MKNNWSSLDNAALIYPSASEKADHQVFRVCCELYDPVDPAILQTALEQTMAPRIVAANAAAYRRTQPIKTAMPFFAVNTFSSIVIAPLK